MKKEIELLKAELDLLDSLLWNRARFLSARRIPYHLDTEYTEKSKEYDEKKFLLEELERKDKK